LNPEPERAVGLLKAHPVEEIKQTVLIDISRIQSTQTLSLDTGAPFYNPKALENSEFSLKPWSSSNSPIFQMRKPRLRGEVI
jgi:hypothetical protein